MKIQKRNLGKCTAWICDCIAKYPVAQADRDCLVKSTSTSTSPSPCSRLVVGHSKLVPLWFSVESKEAIKQSYCCSKERLIRVFNIIKPVLNTLLWIQANSRPSKMKQRCTEHVAHEPRNVELLNLFTSITEEQSQAQLSEWWAKYSLSRADK